MVRKSLWLKKKLRKQKKLKNLKGECTNVKR